MKWWVKVKVNVRRDIEGGVDSTSARFDSRAVEILGTHDFDEKYDEAISRINTRFESFCSSGSGGHIHYGL